MGSDAAHRPPIVGLTGRRTTGSHLGSPPGFADAVVEAYYSDYARGVALAGGLPFHVAIDGPPDAVAEVIDALVLTGGDDVDPTLYGAVAGPRSTVVDPVRDGAELALLRAVLDAGKPVLGICRGHQLLNVALGGTLVPDLPIGEGDSHASHAHPRARRRHDVHFAAGSAAHGLYGERVAVNSFHHQAVDRLGRGLRVSGRAGDGVVEAIELDGAPVLGVQWHPECFGGDPVFGWLVSAARAAAPAPAAASSA